MSGADLAAKARRAMPWVEAYEAPAATPWWPVNAAGLFASPTGDHRGLMLQRVSAEFKGPSFRDLLLSNN